MFNEETKDVLVFTGLVTVVGIVVAFVVRKLAGNRYNEKHHLLWTALVFAITGVIIGFYTVSMGKNTEM